MDLTDSIAPKSDQLDAIDLLSGPRTFTIEKVTPGNSDQPFNFHLREFPRVWRPGKSMRRVIVKAWGSKADAYAGQKVTLYCDPDVEFGGIKVGGTRISHMTGITEPLKVPLLVKRGKSAVYTVQPLEASAKTTDRILVDEWISVINEAGTIAQLEAAWRGAIGADVAREPDVIAAKDKRKTELK